MLYFGEHLLGQTPAPCDNSPTCDCPMHGFGLTEARAELIGEALLKHAQNCLDRKNKRYDFSRLISGPDTLDLLSPSEVYYAGFVLSMYFSTARKTMRKALKKQMEKAGPAPTAEGLAQYLDQLRTEGYAVITTDNMDDAPQEVRDIINMLTGKKKDAEDDKAAE